MEEVKDEAKVSPAKEENKAPKPELRRPIIGKKQTYEERFLSEQVCQEPAPKTIKAGTKKSGAGESQAQSTHRQFLCKVCREIFTNANKRDKHQVMHKTEKRFKNK